MKDDLTVGKITFNTNELNTNINKMRRMVENFKYKKMWNELKEKLSKQYDECLEREILEVYNTMVEMENE